MLNGKDTKYVMVFFAVISLIIICLMIKNFNFIDCCYFFIVIGFAARYLLLGKE